MVVSYCWNLSRFPSAKQREAKCRNAEESYAEIRKRKTHERRRVKSNIRTPRKAKFT